jgi:threonine/homoserine/homoserine lactone efflux protein
MLTFAVAIVFLLITPGPGVLTTAGIGSGYGWRPGLRFLTGLFIGTNLTALLVVSGLAAIVLAVPELRVVLVWGSIAYFVYLASRIAFAGARIGFIESDRAPGIVDGILLQLINPKAYAVNNLIFSGYAFWPQSLAIEITLKLLIVNAIWIPVHLLWLQAGVSLRKLDLSARTQRLINFAMAAALIGVVVLAALSQS